MSSEEDISELANVARPRITRGCSDIVVIEEEPLTPMKLIEKALNHVNRNREEKE